MEIKPNNIYQGDCYELIKYIPDKSIDLVITDPPYEFVMGGNGHSDIAKRKYNQKGDMNLFYETEKYEQMSIFEESEDDNG